MRILYFCGKYDHGHDFFNNKTIENLKACGNVYVLEPKDYFKYRIEDVKYIENGIRTGKERFPHISLFLTSLKNYYQASKYARKYDIDVIIAGEYELLSIWMFRLFCRKRMLLIHHYNLDQIKKKRIFRIIFYLVKNRFEHVVLEDYIVDFLTQDLKVSSEKVYCWRHPVAPVEINSKIITDREFSRKKLDCVGLSFSNDEEFIKEICEYERNNRTIEKEGLHVVLKSRNVEYEDKGLRIIKGFIKQEEYDNLVNNSLSALACYPGSYEYRVSAVIMESVWRKQIVIGTDTRLLQHYRRIYPQIFLITDVRHFAQNLTEIKKQDCEKVKEDFQRFVFDHSDKTIREQMRYALLG